MLETSLYLSYTNAYSMQSAMFQRTLPVVFLFAAATISPAYACNGLADEVKIGSKNSSIGGIKLFMPEQQLPRILGKPLKRQHLKISQCGGTTVVLHYFYKNTKILLYKERGINLAGYIVTSNPLYRTDKGIRVGDSINKAKAADPTLEAAVDSDTFWYSTQTSFTFTTNKKGIISEISLDERLGG
jgi:hypothetical protein